MKNPVAIFSFGYWGWGNHVPELKMAFLNHNRTYRRRGLFWVDIRIRRNVRAVGFRDDNPQELLGPSRYEHIPEFGNTQILSGGDGVTIKDYRAGLDALKKVIAFSQRNRLDLILFCACADFKHCHRSNVMEWLRRQRIPGARVQGEFLDQFGLDYYYTIFDEPAFYQWRKQNPDGYYLNCQFSKRFTLHRSRCHHVGKLTGEKDDRWMITRVPKKCGRNPAALRTWAKRLGATVSNCSDCHEQ